MGGGGGEGGGLGEIWWDGFVVKFVGGELMISDKDGSLSQDGSL